MRFVFLILTHKNIDHIYKLASELPDASFYIHLDKKSNIDLIQKKSAPNVFFIDNRVDIKWAGFSMIQATLNLINYALEHDKTNEFFHLISGDDVILNRDLSWNSSDIFMECRVSKEHQYRLRFDTPHADTKYQRTFLGKVLTQFYKKIDKQFGVTETPMLFKED